MTYGIGYDLLDVDKDFLFLNQAYIVYRNIYSSAMPYIPFNCYLLSRVTPMLLSPFPHERGLDVPLPSVDFMDGLGAIVSPFQLIFSSKLRPPANTITSAL